MSLGAMDVVREGVSLIDDLCLEDLLQDVFEGDYTDEFVSRVVVLGGDYPLHHRHVIITLKPLYTYSPHSLELLQHHLQWHVLQDKAELVVVESADGLDGEIVVRVEEGQILGGSNAALVSL